MNIRNMLLASLAAFTTSALAATEIKLMPGARTLDYHKVLIDPARVEFHPDFVMDMGGMRSQGQRINRKDALRIAQEMSASFHGALIQAFRARGFEVASDPASDVLRLTPTVQNLYVNAPEGSNPALVQSFVRDAGTAEMLVEVRDPSGTSVVVASTQDRAGRSTGFVSVGEVFTRSSFDTMFQRWASDVAVAVTGKR